MDSTKPLPESGAAARRAAGGGGAPSRAAILDATERLMVEDGYAAVSNRKVAAKAGVKPALVQYYFPTMDELFLEVYRRAAQHSLDRQAQVLAGPRPLHALWDLMSDSSRTGLAIEFMVLARRRKSIRAEIGRFAERSFAIQSEALAAILERSDTAASQLPGGVAILLAGAARALVMEEGVGISNGHRQARAIVDRWLDAIEPAPPDLPLDGRARP